MGSIIQATAAFPNLLQAWQHLQPRLPEKVRLAFAWHLEDNLLDISDTLTGGTYKPQLKPVGYHHTGSGKQIPVPCLPDRLVLRALKQALLPRLEPSFIHDTYAGLPERGVHRAVERAMKFQRRVAMPTAPRSGWFLKTDVQNFYPSLRHDILLGLLHKRIGDGALIELMARFLAVWGKWSSSPGLGIPLGSAVSSLLSNLYLDPFDHWIKDDLGFKCYLRYADDMAFLHRDFWVVDKLLAEIHSFLAERLALILNERKTVLKPTADGMDFLGYRLFYHHRLLRRKNMKKVRKRLRRMEADYACGRINQADIQKSLAGWLGYARFADSYNFRRSLFADFRLVSNQEKI